MSIYARLKRAIGEQNWFAVGLEMIIVMGSLLLAFQIDRWYEANQEQKRESDYLQRLKENLETDRQNIQSRIDFYSEVKTYGELAISHYEKRSNPEVDNWDILVAYFQASQIWPILLTSDTYDELKSAGELDLLRSVQLREFLARYYGDQYTNYENTIGIMPEYRQEIRGEVPFFLQNEIWAYCHDTAEVTNIQFLVDCEQPEGIAERDIDRAVQQIEYGNYIRNLRFWISNISVGLDILENQKIHGERVIAMISELQDEES